MEHLRTLRLRRAHDCIIVLTFAIDVLVRTFAAVDGI